MMKRLICAALGCAAAASAPIASAHEFWLSPEAFQLPAPRPIEAQFLVGEGVDIEGWIVRLQRIISLRTYGPDGVTDQMTGAREGTSGAIVSFRSAGAHVLAIETNHAFLELPATEFRDYASHEGITPIVADRAARNAGEAPGREMYSRRAKALIRIGEGDDDIFLRPIGMTLEIVPERCPYHLERGEALPLRVYFHGRPLAGATLRLIRLDGPAGSERTQITGEDGRAAFDIPRDGRWLLGVVWSEALPDRTRADYDTTFASLTFGF